MSMANLRKALLKIQSPLLESRRCRGKINIQRPRKPHFERQLLIDVSKPFYGPPKYTLPDTLLCSKRETGKKVARENPFETILAKECLQWFNTSKMVVFLHMNSISMEDKLPVFAALKKNDMHLRTYGKKIVNMATSNTKFEPINLLFINHQNIIFGQPEKANKMFKIIKKTPQLVVMGGIIEDRLLSKNELVEFSKLPDLQTARSQLCAVLQSAGSALVAQFNQPQQLLASYLDSHVDIQKQDDKKNVDS